MITDATVRDYLPGWMLRASRDHWKRVMRAAFTVADRAIDAVRLGRLASMPGQVAGDTGFPHVEALALIGRDRKIRRGKLETADAYAGRLRDWTAAKRAAGTPAGILYALRGVLQPSPPKLRLVRGGSTADEGYWWTLDDSGLRYQETDRNGAHYGVFWPANGDPVEADSTAAQPFNWDWSYYTGPPTAIPDPSRSWVVIYGPCNSPELVDIEGAFADGFSFYGEADSEGDKYTTGTTATSSYVETARMVCAEFKAAGCSIENIIVTFTPSFLDPADSDPDMHPDGWWKWYGKIINDAGTLRRVRARSALGRYWVGMV